MSPLKPISLKDGARFAIVSPASEIATFPRRTERGIRALESLGYKAALSQNALKKYGRDAGLPQERADDIMRSFKSSDIDAIIASTGGYTSISVLEHLDYEGIRENKKIFLGHSDITSVLLAIYAKTGLVTFYGPTILPAFGDAGGIHPQTAHWFKRVLSHASDRLDLPSGLDFYSDQELFWDKEDDKPRSYEADSGAICIRAGICEGRLVGGNLDTLLALLPTSYFPDLKGSVLFIEEIGGSTSKTLRGLKTLEYAGVFKKIVGLVVGRRFKYDDNGAMTGIAQAFDEIGKRYGIPVLDNLPFGHTEPKLTLPIGIEARLDAEACRLSLLESAVQIG